MGDCPSAFTVKNCFPCSRRKTNALVDAFYPHRPGAGEINSIAHIETFDFIDAPQAGPFVSLAKLPQMLTNLGLTDYRDGSEYLENSYLAYELEPVEDPDADWRLDTYVGSTRLPVLINDYLSAHSNVMDAYHKDGIVAGFLCYPVDGFEGENQAEQILQFRDSLQAAILEHAGADAVTFRAAPPDCTMGIWILLPGICPPYWMQPKIS